MTVKVIYETLLTDGLVFLTLNYDVSHTFSLHAQIETIENSLPWFPSVYSTSHPRKARPLLIEAILTLD